MTVAMNAASHQAPLITLAVALDAVEPDAGP